LSMMVQARDAFDYDSPFDNDPSSEER
jgi:hypothetical protein